MIRVASQRQREVILEILGADKPRTEVDRKAVWLALGTLGHPMTMVEYLAHVDYLREKGYLTETKREALGVTVWTLRLLPDGRDLLDGVCYDPGVGAGCPE